MPGFHFVPYRLLPAQRQLLRDDTPVKLGSRAFDILVALVERQGRAVSKNELMDIVWPRVIVEENNLEVHIVALRKLLGHAAIATVPGRGYCFTLPVATDGLLPSHPDGVATSPVDAPRRTNLPATLPPLIGRGDDLQALARLVEDNALVTVTGTAGIGKTRLAQALALRRLETRGADAWWVDLAPLTDPALVPGAVALALGLHVDGAGGALPGVLAALRDATPLIVLDNAEHLLEGVADFIAQVRRTAPRARLLVTSQEALHLDDECVFRPEPLSLPATDEPARIAASDAVALFVVRARAADRRFELHAGNRVAVAEICRRLDGIPLAIELAAARIPLLGVDGLHAKLDQRFHVLTSGHRAALRRHQTLRAALEWSHQLLSPPEQAVLRRLGVFGGGFTLAAAQQVAEDDRGIDAWDVLEHLGGLVDKSLVLAEGDATPRYRLLETTRLFALERLIESGEAGDVRSRHRDHFLAFAERCAQTLFIDESRSYGAELDRERDNVLLALAWAPGPEDALPGLRLAAALHAYWFLRALPARGLEVTRAALERAGAQAPTPERCRTLVSAGWMSMWVGDHVQARAWLDEALALARTLAEPRLLCHVLIKSAHFRHDASDDAEAMRLATEALQIGQSLGDCIELGEALMQCGVANGRAGRHDQARDLYGKAVDLRQRLHNESGVVSSRLALAQLEIDSGRAGDAKPHLDAALARIPATDARIAGLQMISSTAEWAAATGAYATAVLLDAAHAAQMAHSGIEETPEPGQRARFARARSGVPDGQCAQLERAGAALSYIDALLKVRAFLGMSRPYEYDPMAE